MNKTNFEMPTANLVEMPYPAIKVSERNINYEKIMLDNMSGSNSELSTVSLYFYDSLITSRQYPEISNAFHQTMLTEMKHMEIFGTIAVQLGADPRWWSWKSNRNVYWTPGYNQYSLKLRDVVTNAIQNEKLAIDRYTKQSSMIKDANIVECLNRIIIDEKKHLELFTELFNKYICE